MEEKRIALNHYSEQWKYRHNHFWKLVYYDLFSSLFVILLPNINSKFKLLPNSDNIPLWLFPSFGIFLSILFTYLLLCEAERISTIGNNINKVLSTMGYGYVHVRRMYKPSIAKFVPFFVLAFHIVVASLYLI